MFMSAPATTIWDLIRVTNTGRFSPETFEAEWLDGASGPAVGARFRGHVKRNEIGPVYWTTCRVTACERGHTFRIRSHGGVRGGEQLALAIGPTGWRDKR